MYQNRIYDIFLWNKDSQMSLINYWHGPDCKHTGDSHNKNAWAVTLFYLLYSYVEAVLYWPQTMIIVSREREENTDKIWTLVSISGLL